MIVDLFAGGGGASCGIEMGLGRTPDVAVNHDRAAVAMHATNHPNTQHHTCDVFEVDPRAVTGGHPVGVLWASPDCTFHSKARGGKPIRSGVKKRRALAWVVTRWAAQVRPRVILLENVEEFAKWGPLVGPPDALRPCKRRKGRTFRQWVRSLTDLGYEVQWKELRACDFGAPTIRKRLFVVARCDGRPIVWPEPTHGPGRGRPYRTAAECIDWSIPCPSIFERSRPLADATLRRIARGLVRYVIENPAPYIIANNTANVPRSATEPLVTVTTGGRLMLATPFLSTYYGERRDGEARGGDLRSPLKTQTTENRHALVAPVVVPVQNASAGAIAHNAAQPLKNALVAAFLAQHNAGPRNGSISGRPANAPISTVTTTGGQQQLVAATLATVAHGEGRDGAAKRWGSGAHDIAGPLSTVTTSNSTALVTAHLLKQYGTCFGSAADAPLHTVTTGGKHGLVAAFLATYYGTGDGQAAGEPLRTVTTKDRHAVVTVEVEGVTYAIVDVGMRMLQPCELYRAQGFPDGYIIDRGEDGRALTKTEQVRMVGNSVCPPVAAALVRANVPEMIARPELRKSTRYARSRRPTLEPA